MSPTVEPWLREILRCPACRSTLLDVTDGAGRPGLRCTGDSGGSDLGSDGVDEEAAGPGASDGASGGCGRTYRFEGGVPVLLVDEGVLPDQTGQPDQAG